MSKGEECELKDRFSRDEPSFSPDAQTQLLRALRGKERDTFQRLLASNTVKLEYYYGYPDNMTCLDIACSQPGYSDFVQLLLTNKVDVNKMNYKHGRMPIHFAIIESDLETVKMLLDTESIDVNAMCKGDTPLNLVIKHIEEFDKTDEENLRLYEDILELLLKSGADVNIPDSKGVTPIHSAAKQRLESVVELIIKHSTNPINLDSYKDWRQMTARMAIEKSFPHLLKKLPSKDELVEVIDVHKLFSHLSNHSEDRFVKDFNEVRKSKDLPKILTDNNGIHTLLQYACDNGLDEAVACLLDNGADPNLTAPASRNTPVALACANGYYKILNLLLIKDSTSIEPIDGESLLQIVIKMAKYATQDPNSDYKKCLVILLDSTKTHPHINYFDFKNNTALHYATRSGDQDAVLALLKKGACIGVKNKFDESPLADMSAKTFEVFLDSRLTTNTESPNNEDYEIVFNYSFLAPPTNAPNHETKIPLMDDSDLTINSNDRFLAPETDALLYMTQSQELKPLLKHPVITSFLFLKWQRISGLFYANITFYALFWLSLILYILLGYGGNVEKTDRIMIIICLTRIITTIGLLMLGLRELLQIVMSPRAYFRSVENWLEICLILVAASIIFNNSAKEHTKQQLSAIAILVSSVEFVLLIGHIPYFSTYIVMLKTVSWNFFKFLLWYCILIVAFSLSFFTLFRSNNKNDNNLLTKQEIHDTDNKHEEHKNKLSCNPNKSTEEDEEPDFFLDPGISLFKTIVMLTGEFDAGSINFKAFPITSHIIFVIFVFMIPIILFNLLNGLAVSDTQSIKANAELVGHISRIKLISYFEGVFLGDLNPYKNCLSSLKSPYRWLPGENCIGSRLVYVKPLARRICLFPNYLPAAQIGVKTNSSSRVVIYMTECLKKKQKMAKETPMLLCCFGRCKETVMDGKIVKYAKQIIAEKEEESDDLKQIREKLRECEKKLEKIEHFERLLLQIYETVKK